MKPNVKHEKPIIPILPLHFFPTNSLARTNALVPIVDRPNPLKNRNPAYIQTFVEIAVRPPDTDMIKEERINVFLRPMFESAKVASTSPPTRHPNRKEDEGKPLMKGLAHWRDHSDTVDTCTGESQDSDDDEFLGSLHNNSTLLHLGSLSVKTAIKVCCASKNHAIETKMVWRNCLHPKPPKYCSIVSSRVRGWWCTCTSSGGV
ncbi:hydroxamate-type ferrichrome siderophore peptidesynthetase [Striga asiatica]|uniref:Hydroxamate-type ferrichrome siderophore peptidesynthetase n=1 Tax=Striga asiatica TaxID=4170 RepID=A0A5A7PIM5_STRAF|nr:hydroxamate-type ferrichrome siderophore peptidesynthetase [Striga asiatica]